MIIQDSDVKKTMNKYIRWVTWSCLEFRKILGKLGHTRLILWKEIPAQCCKLKNILQIHRGCLVTGNIPGTNENC